CRSATRRAAAAPAARPDRRARRRSSAAARPAGRDTRADPALPRRPPSPDRSSLRRPLGSWSVGGTCPRGCNGEALAPVIVPCRAPLVCSDLSMNGAEQAAPIYKEGIMPRITPFLWFDTQAEEAMNHYASIFERSRVIAVHRAHGKVASVQFELEGQQFMA